MSTASKAKGTKGERDAVKYLREYWPAAERRALAGAKDKGDIAGIFGVVGEVKAAVKIELAKWQRETLTEMRNADADHCFLVVKKPYKAVAQWDFYLPAYQAGLEDMRFRDLEECRWVRMDFDLGRDVLRDLLETMTSPSFRSLPITGSS
jgi:Holliday junction resolvase